MSKVSATRSDSREPCRIRLLAGGGVGTGVAVGLGVGRGVGRGVGLAVGRGVGQGVGTGDGEAVADSVGVGKAGGVEVDGDGLLAGEHVNAGSCVGGGALGDGAGEKEPGAPSPQLATTSVAAKINRPTDCRTGESREDTDYL
jgi:hypothetical protein